MTEKPRLLELQDVRARLDGRVVIDGLSLSVTAGEIVGLVGNRGAGKRAVLDLVVGAKLADSGSIRFLGRDIRRASAMDRARSGLVSPLQPASRWDRLRDAIWEPTVETIVARGLRASNALARGEERASLVDRTLRRVGLTDVQPLTLRELSAGMDLRVRLAQLLIQQPALIVIDEPFKAWDVITRQFGERLLMDVCEEDGISILISDRSWGVLRCCDRAYVVDEHRIVDEGPPEHVARWFDVGEARGLHSPKLRTAFISYRRDDDADLLYPMYEALAAHFGSHAIWRDIINIRPGVDFKAEIDFAIRKCDVVLAVIGPHWQGADGSGPTARLFDPDDPVRMEIGLALQYGIPVVPVLIAGARMPAKEDLPETMRALAGIQALTLRDPPDFGTDMETLINAIEVARARRDAVG